MRTRRDLIIKWSAYALASLALEFLFALLLRGVRLLGVRVFLPPLLAGVVASQEDADFGAAFALICGLLCDLTVAGTFPCVYTLSFTLLRPAPSASMALAKGVLQPGFLCSVAATLLMFLFVDALNMLALAIKARAPFAPMASLALREAIVSCLPLCAVHPVMSRLRGRFVL